MMIPLASRSVGRVIVSLLLTGSPSGLIVGGGPPAGGTGCFWAWAGVAIRQIAASNATIVNSEQIRCVLDIDSLPRTEFPRRAVEECRMEKLSHARRLASSAFPQSKTI